MTIWRSRAEVVMTGSATYPTNVVPAKAGTMGK